MTLKELDIAGILAEVELLLDSEKGLSSALRAAIAMLIQIVIALAGRLGLKSHNSSKPPSSDPHRKRKERKPTGKKPGGQPGHVGTTLEQVDDPDEIEVIEVDRKILPRGVEYKDVGFERRQVVDIKLMKFVTEYRAQVLEDENGKQYRAMFPAQVTRPVQYGADLKAHAVYLSQFQLLPYDRVRDYFHDQVGIKVSVGSLCKFNKQAYEALADFDEIAINTLVESELLHVDETGTNIKGKGHWVHTTSNGKWTHFRTHAKRGTLAMNEIGILPRFKGILCHDHFKPYFTYPCLHALCNAHHLRELERAWEQDKQAWAQHMQALLNNINTAVDQAGGQLTIDVADAYRETYQQLLADGQTECPPPDPALHKGKRGRQKRSKARNLLERLINFETETLRFMGNLIVPFTNNQAERELRMNKVQQKISGCFRSLLGAQIFCRIRGYLSTCREHDVSASEAMKLLFKGKLPAFVLKSAE